MAKNLTHYEKGNKKSSIDMSTMVYGKVPPQATEIEKLILGAIMLERNAIDIASELLTPESFYLESHSKIFSAILSLSARGQGVDVELVANELRIYGDLEAVGGPYYVMQLTNSVVSGANVEAHCQIVKQKQLARQMIKLGGELVVKGYENGTDVFELIDDHEKGLADLLTGNMGKGYTPMDIAIVDSYQHIEAMRGRNEIMTGIPSGLADLDRITDGWQNTDLIILAARPAVGKTAFALQLARHAAMNHFNPVPVLFFTLEMSTRQLTNRILSAESEIPLTKIKKGHMDDSDMKMLFTNGMAKLAKAPICIDDKGSLTLMQCRSAARRWKRKMDRQKKGGGLIIIDYLQLMSGAGGKGNREQEISEISRGLKQLAKELEVPIIALSQLSRKVEDRKGENKMPQLSDLRESGAIEQDADMVMFLYRPEYYDIESNAQGESTAGETHVKIAKHRNGELDTVKLTAKLSIQKFFSWDGPETFPARPGSSFTPAKSFYEVDKDLF